MKRLIILLLLVIFAAMPAVAQNAAQSSAQNHYIVRHSRGLLGINLTCLLLNCTVDKNLGDPAGQLFLIHQNNSLNPLLFLQLLLSELGVVDAEPDQLVHVMADSSATSQPGPAALYDRTPINYYGGTVRHGYVFQPATALIHLADAQANLHSTGAGIVAVID